jgi:hypothetical protein
MLNIYKILKPKNKTEINKEFSKLSDNMKILYFLKLNLKNINEHELSEIVKTFNYKYCNIITHHNIKLEYDKILGTYIKLSMIIKGYELMKFYVIYNDLFNNIIINQL